MQVALVELHSVSIPDTSWENQQVTLDEVAGELKTSHDPEHQIIHKVPQYGKVSPRWVSKQIARDLKERCEHVLKLFVMKMKEMAFYNMQSLKTNGGCITSS